MGHQAGRFANVRLLVLGRDDAWTSGVRDEAVRAGVGDISAAPSASDALRQLCMGAPTFSHLIVDVSAVGDMLPSLVGLTADDTDLETAVIVMGEATPLSRGPKVRVTFIQSADPGWLARALADVPFPRAEPPRMTLDEMHALLDEKHVRMRYQPIVAMSDSRPVGLEALVRLDHPSRGAIPPDHFVPQLEAAGLAWRLTELVLRRAFAEWREFGLGQCGFLAVNFPLDVLIIPEALTTMEALRIEAGIPTGWITVELTESRPVEHLPDLRRAVSQLHTLGYGLAIDDVGPKIRDHQALLDLRFTALKLDKDLVRESPDSPVAQEFLATTISSARRAGLTIVAEGVEDIDIWQRMASLGVDQAQGFMIARPLPAAAVALWQREWCERHVR